MESELIAKLIVISGPSGAGKGTLIKSVLPSLDNFVVSVSATTRGRRAGERQGVDYHFLSRREFLRKVEEGLFLEWAEYGGNLYGTPRDFVDAALSTGKDVLLEIELEGARQIVEHCPAAVGIFIAPPDLQILEERLRDRKTDSEADITLRLVRACDELEAVERDRAEGGLCFDYAIVNDDLEQASRELLTTIQQIRAGNTAR